MHSVHYLQFIEYAIRKRCSSSLTSIRLYFYVFVVDVIIGIQFTIFNRILLPSLGDIVFSISTGKDYLTQDFFLCVCG